MYSEFAYSGAMQIILMVVAYISSFMQMMLVANLILRIYRQEATIKQKALFAFLTGPILHVVWNYTFYFIWGMRNFSYLENMVIGSANPIIALLYCYLGIFIFKLSKPRAVELMGHMFLYSSIENALNRVLSAAFFPETFQEAGRYNYAVDTTRMLVHIALLYGIYRFAIYIIERNQILVVSQTATIPRPTRDLVLYVLKTTFIYAVMVLVPLFVENAVVASLLVLLILILFFIATLYGTINRHNKADIAKKELHISSLIKSADEFRAVKHDFYNILQTYNGYFMLGDLEACSKYHQTLVEATVQAGDALDLSNRIEENPALVALLLEKYERAKQMHVKMNVLLKCLVSDLPMRELDLCRIVACLLDNAIEAAAESLPCRVSFTIEEKTDNKKMMIITNSTAPPPELSVMFTSGMSEREGHQGVGLNNVKQIIEQYLNCSFQLSYYNNEMHAYVELC